MASARSPIFIEIAGTPAAGKTTIASRLQHYFETRGIFCAVADEPAGRYPNPDVDKLSPAISQWTLSESLDRISEYRNNRTAEVVIFDRGPFDSLFWLSWFRSARGFDELSFSTANALARPLLQHISCVIVLTCSFDVALQRRPQAGRIMNPGIYPQLLANYGKNSVGEHIGLHNVSHLRLDTSELQVGTVEARIRAFIDAPQYGDRDEILSSLTSHSTHSRQLRREI